MISPGMRYNAENVRYRATPWLTGDGSTSSGTLLDRHGNPISSGKLKRVDAIHRTDWQGRQLLYPTARTNRVKKSTDFSAAPWSTFGATLTAGQAAPDGSTHAAWLTASSTGGTAVQQFVEQSTVPNSPGVVVYLSAFVAPDTLDFVQLVGYTAGSASIMRQNFRLSTGEKNNFLSTNCTVVSAECRSLAGGWSLCRVGVIINDTATTFFKRIQLVPSLTSNGFFAWTGGERIKVFGPSVTDAPGVYIETPSTSSVTITDYTLTGPSVALGQVPDVGAVLDWDGVAKR